VTTPGRAPGSGILGSVRVSTKSDYALRALIEISLRQDVVSAEQVGVSQDIPHGFLQAILADLRRAGLVASQRGQSGGWRMAVDPAEVSVADVIRAIDGPLLSVYGVRPESVNYNESAKVLQTVWVAARHSLRSVFETVTIAALASGSLPADVVARTVDEDAWNPH
jgi:Rrf2 family protein